MKIPAKYWMLGSAINVLMSVELILRLAFGLGNPVLVQADPNTGYRFQPNQELVRFGKRIQYNQYSQRSEPITPQKPAGTLRILTIGDSVLNGGNPTDQKQIITELFKDKLTASGHSVEVLNASAGSWGIGNQLGYLRVFGTFDADAVILQIGAHDLTQPTSTSAVVGNHPAFPTHPYLLAIQEAWTRYVWLNLTERFGLSLLPNELPPPSSSDPEQQLQQNMQQLKEMVTLIRAQRIPVYVLFTPNLYDLVPKPQTPPHKSEFLRLLKSLQVPMIDSHAAWSTLPPTTVQTYFRDSVHLSVPGNQAIAQLLFQQLCIQGQFKACIPQKSSF